LTRDLFKKDEEGLQPIPDDCIFVQISEMNRAMRISFIHAKNITWRATSNAKQINIIMR